MKPNVWITVYLVTGKCLNTVDYFEDPDDADNEIEDEIDSGESHWKQIGDLNLFYKHILGWRSSPIKTEGAPAPDPVEELKPSTFNVEDRY